MPYWQILSCFINPHLVFAGKYSVQEMTTFGGQSLLISNVPICFDVTDDCRISISLWWFFPAKCIFLQALKEKLCIYFIADQLVQWYNKTIVPNFFVFSANVQTRSGLSFLSLRHFHHIAISNLFGFEKRCPKVVLKSMSSEKYTKLFVAKMDEIEILWIDCERRGYCISWELRFCPYFEVVRHQEKFHNQSFFLGTFFWSVFHFEGKKTKIQSFRKRKTSTIEKIMFDSKPLSVVFAW
jgi:hypothetical protein